MTAIDEAFDTSPPDPPAPPVSSLGTFEGDPVIRSEVAVTKIGDGLSDALKVEPVKLHRGERVFLVVEAEVRHVAFPPIQKDADELARKHVLDAVNVAIVDEADVKALLEQNRERVQRGLDSIAGQQTFDDLDDDDIADDGEV